MSKEEKVDEAPEASNIPIINITLSILNKSVETKLEDLDYKLLYTKK